MPILRNSARDVRKTPVTSNHDMLTLFSKSDILDIQSGITTLERDPDILDRHVWLGVREPNTQAFYYQLSGPRQKYYAYLPGAPMRVCKGSDFTSRFDRALDNPAFVNLVNLSFDFPPRADILDHGALDDRWVISCHTTFTDARLPKNEQMQKSTRFLVGLKGNRASFGADAERLIAQF